MCIREQIKAIKNCLAEFGYNSSRVECVRVNSNDRTLKVFKVEYQYGKLSDKYLYGFQILVDNSGIIGVNGIDSRFCWALLIEINALHKALGGK